MGKEIKKEDLGFYPKFYMEQLHRDVQTAHVRLEVLKKHLAAHGEGLEDAIEYALKGVNWHVKERLEEVEKHLDKLGVPSYLRQQQRDLARLDLGKDNLEYWRTIPIGIECGIGQPINVAEDVTTDKDGNWVLSAAYIKKRMDSMRIEIPPFMVEDVEDYRKLKEAAIALANKGYEGLFCNESWIDGMGVDLEVFFDAYDPHQDSRAKSE